MLPKLIMGAATAKPCSGRASVNSQTTVTSQRFTAPIVAHPRIRRSVSTLAHSAAETTPR